MGVLTCTFDATDLTANVQDVVLASPHVKKTLEWFDEITAIDLWNPESGKRFNITDLTISCSGYSNVTVFDDTDTLANRIERGSFAPNGGMVTNYSKPCPGSAVDNILKVTVTGTSAVGYITVKGYESD